MPDLGQSVSPQPTIWSVVDQRLGAVDALLLGDQPNDRYRISLTVVNGSDGPEVEALVVYPCRACNWECACGASGEDCNAKARVRRRTPVDSDGGMDGPNGY